MAVCPWLSWLAVLWRGFFVDLSTVGEDGSVFATELVEVGVFSRGLGEEPSCLDGSTGGKRFGFGEKWFAWDAISAASPSADSGRFWLAEMGVNGDAGTKSGNGP